MQKRLLHAKTLVVLIALFLAGLLIPARFSDAGAAAALTPRGYAYLSAPSSLHASEDGISVIDDGLLLSFGFDGSLKDELALPAGTLSALYVGDSLVRMEAGSVHIGNVSLPITATALAVGGDRLFAASGDRLTIATLADYAVTDMPAGGNITALAAGGNTLFYVTESGGDIILNKYSDGAAVEIKRLKSRVDAIACISEREVCYASGSSLTVYDVLTDTVKYSDALPSQVTDACGYNGEVFYLTSGGDVCKLTDGYKPVIILTAVSDKDGFYNAPGALTSRKDTLCVADRGNDRVSILSGGVYSHIKVYDPADIAVDYNGNIYIAASQSVKVYNRAREALLSLRIKDNIHAIVSIAIDYSEPIKNTLYALAGDGTLANLTAQNQTAYNGGYTRIKISVLGDMYALNALSQVVKLNKETLTADTSFSPVNCQGAVDFAVDAKGNVFAAYAKSVVKYASAAGYTQASSSAIGGEVGGIAIAMLDAGSVKYGDIIITDRVRNRISVCSGVTAEMNDSEGDSDYYELMTGNAHRNVNNNSIIHTAAVQNADIYAKPAEMPAKYSIAADTKLIVIDKATYDSDGYWFVLADITGGGGVYGFINKNILTQALPYTDADSGQCTVLADKTELKKYPSLYAESVSTVPANSKYSVLPFVSGYKDIYGNEWLRIAYGDNFEAFVLRGVVSVDGKAIRAPDQNMPKPNARIKAVSDELAVDTYADSKGEEPLDMTIDVGTEVEVVDTFNLSYDYTQIRYSYTDGDDNVIIRTCYVPTQNIYYEETTMYQIIAFIAIIVLIVLAVGIFIIKKRKENILADKQAKF